MTRLSARLVPLLVGASVLALVMGPAASVQAASTGGGGGTTSVFVVGDQSAALAIAQGSEVEFWGAQWWKDNTLSGGPAPASFKGFADTVPAFGSGEPACSGTWTADTGNSSSPPASVPSQIEVIVTTSASQSGSVISGDIIGVLLVNTDPGYAGDPGHAGTGTVAQVMC